MDEKFLLEQIRRAIIVDKIAILFTQLTIDGTVRHLPSIPSDANYAIVTLESTVTTAIVVRTTEDGNSTPTTSFGMPKSHLDSWDILGAENIRNTLLIHSTGGSAATNILNIQYYR